MSTFIRFISLSILVLTLSSTVSAQTSFLGNWMSTDYQIKSSRKAKQTEEYEDLKNLLEIGIRMHFVNEQIVEVTSMGETETLHYRVVDGDFRFYDPVSGTEENDPSFKASFTLKNNSLLLEYQEGDMNVRVFLTNNASENEK